MHRPLNGVLRLVLLASIVGAACVVEAQTLEANPVSKAQQLLDPVLLANQNPRSSEHLGTSLASGGLIEGPLGAPSSYDLRNYGYVTSVKNQGGAGSCWTFATCAALESQILRAGGPANDFSENNMKNRHGFDWGPTEGGNSWMSAAYLSRLAGPGNESDDPYHDWDDRATAPTTIPRQAFLRQSQYYDTSAEIKDAIVAKGALYTTMYWSDGSYNSTTKTYYYSGTANTNHAVTIVGWDDNKATAGGTGAWLIKNSWGASWGDAGYFWISYNDSRGGRYGATFETEAADTVNNVYYHDTFGDVTELNCDYASNVFQTTAAEQLKSVGFYTQVDSTAYTVQIYDSWNDATNRPSGLLATKTGTAEKWGFHVVDLDELVQLGANDEFVVSLYLNDGSNEYTQAVDMAVAGYNSASTASPGQSYYSFNGSSWTDLTSFNSTANFSIKAYTVPEPATVLLLLALFVSVGAWRGWQRRVK